MPDGKIAYALDYFEKLLKDKSKGYLDSLMNGGKRDDYLEHEIKSLEVAIDALKKQSRQLPISIDHQTFKCPSCSTVYECGTNVLYCTECGQKIEWGDCV